MTTLQAIRLLAEQIEYVYETLSEFLPSNYDSELELAADRHCIYLTYKDMGEGEVSDIRFTFLKKYFNGKWVNIGGILGTNDELIADIFKKMMKEHYTVLMRAKADEDRNDEDKYEAVNYAGTMPGY